MRAGNVAISLFMLVLGGVVSRPGWAQEGEAPAAVPQEGGLKGRFARELAADPRQARLLPYNAQIYELGYQVFLANRNLEDAYLLASAAVRQRPDDLIWRKRLAQLAGWTQRPTVALQQWRYIALHDSRDADAAEEALRLARGLYDDQTILALLRQRLDGDPDNSHLWQELISTYERLGEPQKAMALLEAFDRCRPRHFLLEQLDRLAERMGDPERSLEYLDQLVRRYGATPALALRQADLLYQRGLLHQALAKLLAARSQASPVDQTYWQTLGDLAWALQDDANALLAARTLQIQGVARMADVERLVALLKAEQPQEAFDLAREGWRQYRKPVFFFTMLDIASARQDWGKLAQAYDGLTPADQNSLAVNPYFWTSRAQLLQHQRQWLAARAAYEKGLALDPRSASIRGAYIWLLLEQQDGLALRATLSRWASDAPNSPALWGPYAAAYLFLGQAGKAIPFYRRQLTAHRDDYLWLLSYADALEQADRNQAATAVRRHAWIVLRHRLRQVSRPPSAAELQALARLAMQEAPGDPSANLMARVAAGQQDAASRELVLSWALSDERYELARIWLWRQYAGSLARPRWAELSLALAEGDLEKVAYLLRRHASQLPVRDRIEAARRIGDPGLAEQLAFEGQENHPKDDELYQQMTTLMLDRSQHVDSRLALVQRDGLERLESHFSGMLNLSPRLALLTGFTVASQTTNNTGLYANVPAWDQAAELGLRLRTRHGEARLFGGQRQALSRFGTFRLAMSYRWNSSLDIHFNLGRNQPADESTPLFIGGVKDEGRVQLTYQFGPRNTFTSEAAAQSFHSQERYALGRGRLVALDLRHQLHFAYPDVAVHAFASIHDYQTTGPVDGTLLRLLSATPALDATFLLPADFFQWGAGVAVGGSSQGQYSRAWRPYATLDLARNSATGFSYYTSVGGGGRVFGRDRLSLFFTQGQGTRGLGETDRSVGLKYQYFWGP